MEEFNNMEDMIDVVELGSSALSQEVVEFVTVVEDDIYDIELDHAFPAVGEANEKNRHDNLMGRDEPNQHIITSISGLRDELDSIEALQTFYSDKRGRADYYLWEDVNKIPETPIGHFVSLSSETNNGTFPSPNSNIGRVRICNEEKIFGVVVSEAGFIGWQDDIERDNKYALIASDGIVAVRCDTSVVDDCYVLSNDMGMATRSLNGYGYKVVSLAKIGNLSYAVINLNASMESVSELADNVSEIESRVDKAEENIVSIGQTATEAYNLAIKGGGSGGSVPDSLIQDVNNALQNSQDAMNTVNSWSGQISDANSVAVQAKQIALGAVSSAESIKQETLSEVSDALDGAIKNVTDIQEEIKTYQIDINKSIQEFDGTINGAISNIDNLDEKVDGLRINIGETTNKIDENSATIQNLAALIHSHYVGVRSRAHGLSTTQIDKVLAAGTIYVPIENHTERYACSEKSIDAEFYTYSVMGYSPAYGYSISKIIEEKIIDADTIYIPTRSHVEAYVNNDGTEIRQNFIKGYAYEWDYDDGGWIQSETECVSFSNDSSYYRYDEENNKFYVDNEDAAFLHDGYIYQDFVCGYYYTWNGSEWNQPFKEPCVWITKENLDSPDSSENLDPPDDPNKYYYWYTGSNKREDGYNTETLYYYKDSKWVAVATLGENITHRVVSLIQQFVDENAATIDLLADHDKEQSEAIASISLKADENSASIQNITSYTNKYAVGDLSPADGFTIEEANDYFVSDVYYVPTDDHREEYGAVESLFYVGYLYTWNGNGWTESEIECVHHGGDVPTDVKHTHWYTKSDDVADGYEKETLYLKEDDVWVEVAKLNGLITNTVASIRQKVNQNSSFIGLLANYKNKDTDATAGIIAAVQDHESKLDVLASYTYTDDDGEEHTNISSLIQQVDKNKADIESFAQYDGDIQDSLASIRQQADANGASIQALVASLDKYTVGEYSQAYGLTYELAKELVKVGSIFVPTESGLEESYENGDEPMGAEFTKGSYYTWEENENGNLDWIEHHLSVWHQAAVPVATNDYIYWFNTNTVEENGYIPQALYKWEDNEWKLVALLSDNSLSRAISSWRATQNSIEEAVNSTKGDVTATKKWVEDNEVAIQDVVNWKSDNGQSLVTFMETASENFASAAQVAQVVGDDGKITAASIIAAVNEDTSGVTINADHINLEGAVTISSLSDDVQNRINNSIKSTIIEYNLSESSAEFIEVDGCEWSATAPQWTDGLYMWQRTTIKYTDGDTITTMTCIQGAKGEDGGQGNPGKSVLKVVPEYYCSKDGSISSNESDWYDYPISWENDNIVYVRYRIYYDDGTTSTTDAQIDETFTTIGDWCVASDTTLIHGSKIATGTLDASKITTGILKSPKGGFEINLDNGTITMNTQFSVTIVAGANSFTKARNATSYSPETITCTAHVSGSSGGTFEWKINNVAQNQSGNSISVGPGSNDDNVVVEVTYKYGDASCSDTITISKISIDIGDIEVNADVWEFVLGTPYITIPVDSSGKASSSATYTCSISGYKNGSSKTGINIQNSSLPATHDTGTYYFKRISNSAIISGGTLSWSGTTLSIQVNSNTQVKNGFISIECYYSNGTEYIAVKKEIYINASKEDAIINSLSFTVGSTKYALTPANLTLAINNIGQSSATISADKINLKGYTTINDRFTIDDNGYLTANGATIKGNITADDGEIGGWEINSNYIKTSGQGGANSYKGSMELLSHDANINHWMRVFNQDDKMVFSIRRDGYIEAKSGRIAGWEITDSYLRSDQNPESSLSNRIILYSASDSSPRWIAAYNNTSSFPQFYVQKDGFLYAKNAEIVGKITATEGTIGGCNIVNGVLQVNTANIDGTLSASRISGGTLDCSNITTTNLWINGYYVTGYVDNAYNATNLDSNGTIGDNASFAGGNGYLVSGDGYARLTSPNAYTYVGVNDNAIYMRIKVGNTITNTLSIQSDAGRLTGTWWVGSEYFTSSDRNKKNSITDMTDSYGVLFDNLHPVLFKYNDGTSGRTHTGFIAQDVCDAIEHAGLDTDDFAAYAHITLRDDITMEPEKTLGLRYGEFVSLNTWQIQKCKKRISDLEAKIEELEKKINRNEE